MQISTDLGGCFCPFVQSLRWGPSTSAFLFSCYVHPVHHLHSSAMSPTCVQHFACCRLTVLLDSLSLSASTVGVGHPLLHMMKSIHVRKPKSSWRSPQRSRAQTQIGLFRAAPSPQRKQSFSSRLSKEVRDHVGQLAHMLMGTQPQKWRRADRLCSHAHIPECQMTSREGFYVARGKLISS